MPKPTLTEVFGAGATQTATTVTILKADLPGLTPAANNTAESLVVAIALKTKANLTTTAREGDIDRRVAIESGFSQILTRNNTPYRQDSVTISFQKPDTASAIDPDDY